MSKGVLRVQVSIVCLFAGCFVCIAITISSNYGLSWFDKSKLSLGLGVQFCNEQQRCARTGNTCSLSMQLKWGT